MPMMGTVLSGERTGEQSSGSGDELDEFEDEEIDEGDDDVSWFVSTN